MSPYRRQRSDAAAAPERARHGDDWAVHVALFAVGAVAVVIAVVRGGPWGAEPAFGLLLCLCVGRAALGRLAVRRAARRARS